MNSSEQSAKVDPDALPEREPMRPADWIILAVLALITGLWVILLVLGVHSLLSLI